MNHTLMTIDEYARRFRPLHPTERLLVLAAVTKGWAIQQCRCGDLITARAFGTIESAHAEHLAAVVAGRRQR